jgi:hypothetical protein
VTLTLKGKVWRRIAVEISPDEGSAGDSVESIPAPTLAPFGLPSPDSLATLAMSYQIAQKVHASTDPHEPPASVNERARDVIDLILLKDLVSKTGAPTNQAILTAIIDIFGARATEARTLQRPERKWPAQLTAHPHWREDFAVAATSAGIVVTLEEAVAQVNAWLETINRT